MAESFLFGQDVPACSSVLTVFRLWNATAGIFSIRVENQSSWPHSSRLVTNIRWLKSRGPAYRAWTQFGERFGGFVDKKPRHCRVNKMAANLPPQNMLRRALSGQ